MKEYGLTESTVRPNEVELFETKVLVSQDIEEFEREDEQGGKQTLYRYNLYEYSKDEYIQIQAVQVTELQDAVVELYEMLEV